MDRKYVFMKQTWPIAVLINMEFNNIAMTHESNKIPLTGSLFVTGNSFFGIDVHVNFKQVNYTGFSLDPQSCYKLYTSFGAVLYMQ